MIPVLHKVEYRKDLFYLLIDIKIADSKGKTIEVYNKFVKKVASIFENKKGLLVSITIIIFGILASVVSEPLILIAFNVAGGNVSIV